jgi:hypothetical protein
VSGGAPQPTCRNATDFTELLLQVYLIAWNMSEAKDAERSRGRMTPPRPAVGTNRWFGGCGGVVHNLGRRERRGVRHLRQPARVAGAHCLYGSGLTREGCAAASAVKGILTRLRDLHGASRPLDERRGCRRRTAVCGTAAELMTTNRELTTTNRVGFASPAASRRVWSAASRFASCTASRPYLAGSATKLPAETYVGS